MHTPIDRRYKALGWALAAAILAVAAVVRLIDLGSNPPGLWQDEASTGLDAWLLWTTGKDRAGAVFPIIARSFGDYPLAGYRYLAAPIVGTFGLTIAHERIVAAVAGVLMVPIAALAVRRSLGNAVALATLLSAALCPTWIHFSRYGSEAILLPLTLITGFALFESGRSKDRRWLLWPGALALAASAYTYHAVKLILPLWMAAFLVYHWPLIKTLWRKEKRHLIGPAILFALAVAPSVHAAFSSGGMARGKTVLAWYHHDGYDLVRVTLNNYLTYFDPGMLFVRGGPAVAQSIPGLGLWNLVELPLIAVGLLSIARGRVQRRLCLFVGFWFLLGPLPGGMTYETHNIGRVIAWLPAPQIISAIGMIEIARRCTEIEISPAVRLRRSALFAAFCCAWIATAINVGYLTLVKYPATTERDWQFEISDAILCAKDFRTDEHLVISPRFQAADVFTRFHLWDLDKSKWRFGTRSTVLAGELYVTPATTGQQRKPKGRKVCTIAPSTGGTPRAYVYAHKSPIRPPLKTSIDLEISGQPALTPLLKFDQPSIVGSGSKSKRRQ